jgi:hypothetical protein
VHETSAWLHLRAPTGPRFKVRHHHESPRSGAKANDSFTKVCGTSLTSLPQYTGQVALGDYGREKAQKAQRKQRAGFLRFLCLFVAKCSAPVLSPRVLAPDLGIYPPLDSQRIEGHKAAQRCEVEGSRCKAGTAPATVTGTKAARLPLSCGMGRRRE